MNKFKVGDKAWTLAFDTYEYIKLRVDDTMDDQCVVSYLDKDFIIPSDYLHPTKAQAESYFNKSRMEGEG